MRRWHDVDHIFQAWLLAWTVVVALLCGDLIAIHVIPVAVVAALMIGT
ncbi:uncharacterized membrane protein YhaH (DUF805 family) [Cryobacterium sp. CAN_C3]|nr:hypothetical protein [Cryobacterium sp. CAN_C3]MEC5154969.1 uncharacterized membrane protein YhaH (DUF805 family) [Cryobacterium sp. CAN_C3]